jgi:hypothetical protein
VVQYSRSLGTSYIFTYAPVLSVCVHVVLDKKKEMNDARDDADDTALFYVLAECSSSSLLLAFVGIMVSCLSLRVIIGSSPLEILK